MPSKLLLAALAALLAMVLSSCGSDSSSGAGSETDAVAGNDLGSPFLGDNTSKGADTAITPPDNSGETTKLDASVTPKGDASNANAIESAEMVVKIVRPTPLGSATVTSQTGLISGIVTGIPDKIEWETDGGARGETTGIPFWTAGGIPLNPGSNRITVTAIRGNERQTDRIELTVNPQFKFGSRLKARPDVLFTGQNVAVVFTVDGDLYRNFVSATLQLEQVTPDGNPVGAPALMRDDGNTQASGDEIAGDARFTARIPVQAPAAPGRVFFRAKVQLKVGAGAGPWAFSEVLAMDIVQPITTQECQNVVALHTNAMNAFQSSLGSGGQDAAIQAALDTIKASPQVAEAGRTTGGFGVWVRYKNGLLGALPLSPATFRGAPGGGAGGEAGGSAGGEAGESAGQADAGPGNDDGSLDTVTGAALNTTLIGSRSALLLSPFASDFDASGTHENTSVANLLGKEVQCPSYRVVGPVRDSQANLNMFQEMYRYGIVSIASHGDTYFDEMSKDAKEIYGWFHLGAQELIWTGETINCSAFTKQIGSSCTQDNQCGAGARCVIQSLSNGTASGVCVDYLQVDLRRGRIAFGSGRYGILPSFVLFHAREPYPNSVVYLGTCRSTWNGSMAAAFFAAGARTILGYSGYVTSKFASQRGSEFFDRLIRPSATTGRGLLSGQAHLEIPDPDNPDAFFRLIGARNLDASRSELINASWESGGISGWDRAGDGRVVGQLGNALPVEGKFMSIISTGLGFTTLTGELSQTFCVPAGRTKLSFWWRFYSEEFLEWCGSNFQDTFQATLESDIGSIQPVNVSVDDICPKSQCLGCNGLHPVEVSDVGFDKTDMNQSAVPGNDFRTYRTPWIRTEVALPNGFAGGPPVTLRLFATDKGDSIFDSAILIDAVKVE